MTSMMTHSPDLTVHVQPGSPCTHRAVGGARVGEVGVQIALPLSFFPNLLRVGGGGGGASTVMGVPQQL
jgi:hypothetical protein